MLVLTRKQGEKLIIGDTVISVEHVSGKKVRIGIEAPPEVLVLRAELPPRDEGKKAGERHR